MGGNLWRQAVAGAVDQWAKFRRHGILSRPLPVARAGALACRFQKPRKLLGPTGGSRDLDSAILLAQWPHGKRFDPVTRPALPI